MVDSTTGDGGRRKFQVAYIGENPDDHTIDADALGAALVGYAQLIRIANMELNKNRATVKLLVESDFEHKCFNINFELIQTVLDTIRTFLDDKEAVANATALLTKIGVIGGVAGGAVASVFGYLKWKKGRMVEKVENSGSNNVIVHIHGDGNTLNLAKDVYQLAENSQVLAAVDAALAPVVNKEAKRVEFRQDDRPLAVLDENDVKAIEASVSAGPSLTLTPTVPDPSPQTVTATLHVYSPVFDVKAPMWRFLYRNKPIYADISDTDIARDAVKRGGSFRNDRYRVKVEVTPPKKPDGDAHYKIIQVLDFTPAEQQITMPLKKPRKKRGSRSAKA
ncbi:hypothetical protein KMZ93_03815 [Bradyrhizobium sediminis]|uniref:Uncharacterized protein n=1 Tax=Bradyrhizobium sediminis TaxID=2840469 RepID=A0A975P0I6_9BRAD|nr:hypothetical protein [Bradyrhizobium sediminis]QWG24066.1 hypothetical protein KMZ93_03815 [Bradyrhizobium sediminis]